MAVCLQQCRPHVAALVVAAPYVLPSPNFASTTTIFAEFTSSCCCGFCGPAPPCTRTSTCSRLKVQTYRETRGGVEAHGGGVLDAGRLCLCRATEVQSHAALLQGR
jgi:hypothetical protein